jgi:uncharacterized OB-fold protein
VSRSDYPVPVPHPTGLNAEWYSFCAKGELRFQRCNECERWRHPPRVHCAGCGCKDWTWERSSGNGRLYSWTVTHKPLHPSFADVTPYSVVVVELEEGVRIVCSVRDIPNESLSLDLPVSIDFAPTGKPGIALPYAQPRWLRNMNTLVAPNNPPMK